ncbi:hypothetical protein ACF0H5_020120 [Mactra antiquata]
MRDNCGQGITRYNICSLGCSAYLKALTPGNLQSSFRKAGIYPLNPDMVHPSNFKPSEVLQQEIQEQSQINNYTVSGSSTAHFFRSKEANIIAKKPATKKRRCLSRVVSGKAITEDMVISQIIDHENTTTQKRKQNKSKEPSAEPSKLQTLNPSVVISDSESDKEADEVPC